MPQFQYTCQKCGYTFGVLRTPSLRNVPCQCEMCLGPAERNVEAEYAKPIADNNSDHPRWSWAMGCTPDDAQEAIKKHPELESDFKFGKFGGPLIVRNRQDKLRKMKMFNMDEWG